jgi:hypothetical protein
LLLIAARGAHGRDSGSAQLLRGDRPVPCNIRFSKHKRAEAEQRLATAELRVPRAASVAGNSLVAWEMPAEPVSVAAALLNAQGETDLGGAHAGAGIFPDHEHQPAVARQARPFLAVR